MNFAQCEMGRDNEQFYLRSPSFQIELDDFEQDKLQQYQRAPQVKLGIRPEDVAVFSAPEKNSLPAQVDFVEPQGERTILIVRLAGDESFLIEVDPDFRAEIGSSVNLRFDLNHTHLFEAETGRNLLY